MSTTDVLSLIWSSMDRLGITPIITGVIIAIAVVAVVAYLVHTFGS
jgi:FlaG/FlaF family flagellin (archaellin)